jgi:hypothetical protein
MTGEPRYSIETHVRVYDNNTGDYITVGPDRDGLDMVELKYVPVIGHKIDFCMPKEEAILVAQSILKLYGE